MWYDGLFVLFGVFFLGVFVFFDIDIGFECGNYIFVFKVISLRRKILFDVLDVVWECKDL